MTYEQETLWVAGWLEGEGCFGRVSPRHNGISITGKTTDKDILDRVAKILAPTGVSVHLVTNTPKHHKPVWEMKLSGQRAVDGMKRILPFMGQRRKQKIEELLAIASTRQTNQECGYMGGKAKAARWKDRDGYIPRTVVGDTLVIKSPARFVLTDEETHKA